MVIRKKQRSKRVRSPADSAAGRPNVLVEEFQRQVKFVSEQYLDIEPRLFRKMDEKLDDVRMHLSVLRGIAGDHSTTLRGHTATLHENTTTLREHTTTLREHTATLQEHSATLEALRGTAREHSEKLDRLTSDMKAVVATLNVMNAKLDQLVTKDEHRALEGRVAVLEAKAG